MSASEDADAAIAWLGLVDEEDILLDAAALDLAALDHPGVVLEPYHALILTLAERVAARGVGARSGQDHAAVLAAVIAQDYGFTGDRAQYDDPANADMIRVIDRRKGLPIALAILFVATARRVGWEADALDVPGHVLVSVGPATSPVLTDPFGGGEAMAPERLAALLAQVLPPGTFPAHEHLRPMGNRAVLLRLLRNQAVRAEQVGDAARALTLYDRMTVIAPGSGQGWWDLARLRLTDGDIAGARASLSAMLEMTRDPERRGQIADALGALTGL